MGMVSARVDDKLEKRLRAAKINLSAVIRRAFQEEAHRLDGDEALRNLARIRAKSKPAKVPSEQIVREQRDAD